LTQLILFHENKIKPTTVLAFCELTVAVFAEIMQENEKLFREGWILIKLGFEFPTIDL
jgi:hypothetical protein